MNGNASILTAYYNIYQGVYDIIRQRRLVLKEEVKSLLLKQPSPSASSDYNKISNYLNMIHLRILHESEVMVSIIRSSGESRDVAKRKKWGGTREIFSKFYGVLRNILDVKGVSGPPCSISFSCSLFSLSISISLCDVI
jgi:hypothetical protein